MKVKLVMIGKTDLDYIKSGIAEYEKRLSFYIPFSSIVIQDIKNTKKLNENQQKQKEGELILDQIKDGDYIVLLDEKGKEYSSVEFSGFVEKQMIAGTKNLVFIIGGPYGFSEDVYSRAKSKLALSKMTFSHQMVRLIFMEQLYRAMTIIRGEPYHHQ
ncbi:MAG: 23S rRNA (pseudouridine(1915)-N(3))-methyltransferase RlmH [Bacteroidetes bacterium GWC2_33_15]|nr:MAG: 23S rRNA (pseudouridine(1915)-N(3))-methyltransferase RlmH [Bacteroidetes bacterium GWA2_33_15]OFX50203.1 MAG: 23S rRNA (pseudouridine(1915)-N(3))-methyltransferase RlmH [Bacteroidetes bacterium GWC2_33_15]OFX65355.1 MAG: 23S rRNA (pseudouridine(1915)-N(3))-methyltransferase RlmH [Bacteroidetes bacterium GWB2_32_14]OFX70582.1 MAG: 23S rRNA (pseudouridine(1915)-N(3))-methyltransferase RlmH [Bacteroidetes bacterium GWD2_33_33]HAN19543.1 23S rRNA (pseudouridine(1915)-N(3))-methyltransferas